MPEDSSPSPETPPPNSFGRRVGTGLAGETTRSEGHTILPDPNQHPLDVIGDFEVLGKLGQGGMGAVYRARQVSLHRQVALKILPASLEADAEFVTRFQREARLAASLSHANLVKVYTSGQADGCHYIAMELVEGETLGDWLKRGALPPLEALRIILDVAQALECGWRTAQLIHRDIKPGNIFLSIHGEVKLGDLGLAKTMSGDSTGLTQTGTAMGTPHYISPEQARGDRDLDFRADIYSLGCTLYQMLTGRTPYEGSSPLVVMGLHRDAPPPAILKVMPQCPIPLARLVSKMLKKQRRERHPSYEELIAQIESVRAQLDPMIMTPSFPASNQPQTPLPPIPSSNTANPASPSGQRSKTTVLYGGIAAGIVALGLVAWLVWPKNEKLTAAQRWAREHGGQLAEGSPAPEGSSSVKPNPAGSPLSSTPIVKAESWQPILADAEWKAATKDHEIKDGLLNVHGGIGKLQPSSDGAIRARFPITAQGMANPSIFLRDSGEAAYKLVWTDGNGVVVLNFFSRSTRETIEIGRYALSKPLAVGETALLELRVQGPHLTAKVNGVPAITCDDNRLAMPGRWGVNADNVSFESVDVQPLPGSTSTEPATASKDAPFVNTLGMKLVPVPIMGGPTAGKSVLFSVWDTRVQDYEAFVKETQREWPKASFEQGPTHPAVIVSWEDAQAFCAWLTERERKAGKLPANDAYRLPSDHEWSCAVGIADREDAAKLPVEKSGKINDEFPWGAQWPPPAGAGNFAGEELQPALAAGEYSAIKGVISGYRDDFIGTAPVGSFAANRFGLFDMGGNVTQWCNDWYDKEQKARVLRGAAWVSNDRSNLLASHRLHSGPGTRYDNYGFRCVIGVSASFPESTGEDQAGGRSGAVGLEPRAIRLWDSPDKIPKNDGARWEKGALRLDHTGITYGERKSHDFVLRVSILMSADNAGGASFGVRNYTLAPILDKNPRIELRVYLPEGIYHTLGTWPLPRSYKPDEWARLELRSLGDRFTAVIDGYTLGTIEDLSRPEPGGVSLGVVRNGYFRDIVYVPLDGASLVTRSTQPALEPGALRLFDTLEKVAHAGAGFTWENGALRLDMRGAGIRTPTHDAALRCHVLMNADAVDPQLMVRFSQGSSGKESGYSLGLRPVTGTVWLGARTNGVGKTLQSWKLPRTYSPDEWLQLELRAVGEELTVSADGTVLGSVRDGSVTQPGGMQVYATAKGYFRDIVYVPLDGASAAGAVTPALSNGIWKPLFTAAEWRAPGKNHEFKDARLHLTNSGVFLKQQTSPDEALRARIDFREGSASPGIVARQSDTEGNYKLRPTPDEKFISLQYCGSSGSKESDRVIGTYPLPKPLQAGDTLLLALSIRGDRLTGFVNGVAVIEAQDKRLKNAGKWGIYAPDGWYESAEVQILDPPTQTESATLPREPWQDVLHDSAKLVLSGGAERTPEGLRFTDSGAAMVARAKGSQRDGAVRMRATFGGVRPVLRVRAGATTGVYQLATMLDGKQIVLFRTDGGSRQSKQLRLFPLAEPLQTGQDYELELRAVGQTLTAKFNGKLLGTATDGIDEEGQFGVGVVDRNAAPALIKAFEFLDLDAPGGAGRTSGAKP